MQDTVLHMPGGCGMVTCLSEQGVIGGDYIPQGELSNLTNSNLMNEHNTPSPDDLFTIEEVAKWCNLTRNAAYMHYRRGHLQRVLDIEAHRVYFTRAAIDAFRAKYCPLN